MSALCKDVSQLDKDTQEALKVFMSECESAGLSLRVTETFRTVERQKALYAQGRTQPGKVVTNCDGVKNKSIHQSRRAFDVCNLKGDPYDIKVLHRAGEIGIGLGLVWGGSWGWDSPHFELPPGKKVKPLKVEDTALKGAVNKIIESGININATSWNNLQDIKLSNVPALLVKLGGLDSLIKRGVIKDTTLWSSGAYQVKHVKSLLINYASKIK